MAARRGRPQQRTVARQQGFTLVELMVGMVVGLIVISGVIALYITVIQGSAFATREARLTQETRISIDFMTDDLRRAGYSHSERLREQEDGPVINPFMEDDLNIAIHDGGQCILLSYDPTYSYRVTDPGITLAHDLSDLWGDEEEERSQFVFGYRLSGNEIQMLVSPVRNTLDCNAGEWASLTDPLTTNVTTLDFDASPSRCMEVRSDGSTTVGDVCPSGEGLEEGSVLAENRRITISLEAEHTQDSNTRVQYSNTVSVRNVRITE